MKRIKKTESLSKKVDAAFRQAAEEVLKRARQTGTPVILWEDGRVKVVPATELELPATDKD